MYKDFLNTRSLAIFCCISENLSVSRILKTYVYVVVIMVLGFVSNRSLKLVYLCYKWMYICGNSGSVQGCFDVMSLFVVVGLNVLI